MWYVFFTVNGVAARLEKGYRTKGNASKYGKKILGAGFDEHDYIYVVAQENPFDVKKG